MNRRSDLQVRLSLLLTVLLSTAPLVPRAVAAPQQNGRGQGSVNKADPCAFLPTPSGNAAGIEKLCPAFGTSSGIAKSDFNGDGIADLAIGEPGATVSGASSAGDVIIVYGSPDGLSTTNVHGPQFWDLGRVAFKTPLAGDAFGAALAAGDFNGDGYSDLAIGIPNRDETVGLFKHTNAGAVVILYGSANGLQTVPTKNYFDCNDLDSHHSFTITYDNAHFGQSLAWGNFNGDFSASNHDIGDLAIGIPGAAIIQNAGFSNVTNAGAVWVLGGAANTGLDDTLESFILPFDNSHNSAADFSGASFGASLGAVNLKLAGVDNGTFNLIVGAPGKTDCEPGCVAGAGYFELIGLVLTSNTARSVWSPSDANVPLLANEHFGACFAVGDFNGDGYSDIAIGIPERTSGGQTNAGAVVILYNQPGQGFLSKTGTQLLDETNFGGTPQSGDHFATALAAGDFNADGRSDLAVGVPFKAVLVNRNGALTTLLNAGEVDVMYGSSTGLSTARVPQRWNQDTALGVGSAGSGNRFGAPMTAWNFGRNEITGFLGQIGLKAATDLAVGAPFQTVNSVAGAGALDVMYGSFASGGLTSSGSQIWTADRIGLGGLAGAHFGAGIY